MTENNHDPITAMLHECETALTDLKAKHKLTEDGVKPFAELASKVRAEIDRRAGVDRRAVPRETPDRRGDGVHLY